ncbi:MAG: hypothetical protein P1U56_19415 [Saprospiraceae bacterium]|nr:hypothetical protein [Saprospiraceae bacterium]
MTQCKFIIVIILTVFLFSCGKDKIPDVYFPGVVIVKANEDYQNGMIKALDVFSQQEGIEAASRAIIYEFNESANPLDLEDTVFYKINECRCNNLLLATDIYRKEKVDSGRIANNNQIYLMKNNYKINLHLADGHREGPKHKRRHIRPPKKALPSNYDNYDVNYKWVELVDPETMQIDTAIIYDLNNVDTGRENVYFFSTREGNPPFTNIDALDVFNVSLTHDHTIE